MNAAFSDTMSAADTTGKTFPVVMSFKLCFHINSHDIDHSSCQ